MTTDRYMEPTDLSGYNEAPIDLSRVCDSVETRTTPSPYNSSGCEESSPYRLNESPISLTSSQQSSRNYSAKHTQSRHDSASLTQYQSHPFQQQHYSLSHGHESTGFTHKKHRLSLPTQQHLHHLQSKHSINSINDEFNSNIQHAVALQQNMQTSSVATVLKSDKLPSNELTLVMMERDAKLERPFKAYEKESSVIDFKSDRFNIFRQQMLKEMNLSGFPISNPNMRRTSNKSEQNMDTEMELQAGCISDTSSNGPSTTKSEMVKDLAYYERRKKNNEAAKKSRDRRKMKEDEIAIRIAFLEQENFQLKIELAAAKRQVELFLRK